MCKEVISTDNTYKMKLIESGLFKKTYSSKHEYRGRCPFCGHSANKFYIRIDLDSDDPVMYNCFHCPAHGYLNYELLERLGLEDSITLPKEVKRMKKIPVDTIADAIPFESLTKEDDVSKVSQYIQSHIGCIPTYQDLLSFQYIGNPSQYCSEYLGMDDIDALRDNRVWFKSTNGNITGCDLKDNSWRKYHSTRTRDAALYQMKTMVDLMNDINVVIADGIMDVIGLYYNYDELDNCMYVATCGKQYQRGILHMLKKGIFGKGVNIHIFKNKFINVDKIFIDNDMRKLFNRVFIYENVGNEYSRYGVMKDQLSIHRIGKR